MKRIKLTVILRFLLCVLISFSCNYKEVLRSFEIQLAQQRELLNDLQSKIQLVGFSYDHGTISIVLGNGQTYYFSDDYTPVLSIVGDYWMINSEVSFIKVEFDEQDNVRNPVLSIGDNENWWLDGSDTGVKVKKNQERAQIEISYIIKSGNVITLVHEDGSKKDLSIISDPGLIVPEYYIEMLSEKEDLANDVIYRAGKDQASFVFFTDAHWGQNSHRSPALIQHIINNTPITRVIFGGDVITTSTSTIEEALEIGRSFERSFSFLGNNLFCLYGNHDNNSDGQVDQSELHLTEQQVYSFLQSQMDNVNYWDYYNYYFDDTISKTRYVCLDTGRFYYKQFRDASAKTADFLVEVLNSVPHGWHIILSSHLWCGLQIVEGVKECFLSSYIKPFITVADDYNARKAGVFKYGNEAIAYDFSKVDSKIEFCIGGHNHRDGLVYSDGGIPIVIVTTDSWRTINGEVAKDGTVSEQAVTIVVADYLTRKLNLFRIGRGEDRIIPLNNN